MTSGDEYSEYKDWQKKQGSLWTRFSKQVKSVHLIGFFVLIIAGNWATQTGKIPMAVFFTAIIAFALVFLFVAVRESNEPKLIPEHIIKQIGKNALEKKRGEEIPFDAKIKITLIGEVIHEQDMISRTSGVIKREVGFQLIKKGYAKSGVIGIHPYNGIVLGIRWERLGYSGKETKDRILVPVNIIDQGFKGK